uniref:Hypothetical conserved protein n=1 Tax=Glossina morsitans morsitans TaxID=37546 RepID=A0A1B0FEC8_GLOMM
MADINAIPLRTSSGGAPASIKRLSSIRQNTIDFLIEDETDFVMATERPRLWSTKSRDDGQAYIRYFSVGPSTYHIRCPLCKQRSDAEIVQMTGALGQLSCLLSTLSCCFPIFSLSFVYLCLQSRLKSKRVFCNKCGGHLGFYCRPT